MSQQTIRPFPPMVGGGGGGGGGVVHLHNNTNNVVNSIIDTTYTKLFVGGLAWETQRDTMRHYFEQFGEIQEAVVITDKNTGRSKGYGFVTFKDPEAAMRACQNPAPVIDGRRTNCNLASLGAQKPTRSHLPHHGRFRAGSALVGPSAAYQASPSTYFHQPTGQYTQVLPYSAYGYSSTGYSQDNMLPMNYYGMYYGGQQYSPFYTTGASGAAGVYYPYYAQYSQASQGQGFGVPYPLQYQYLSQRYASSGILSLPPSPSALVTTASDTTVINIARRTQNSSSVTVIGGVVGTVAAAAAATQVTRTVSEQSSSN